MTCEYNLSFYIYENKKMNSYLQKQNGNWLYTETIEETKNCKFLRKKLKNTRQPKVMFPQNFAQKKSQ